jgi:hypothetical protein
MTLRVRSAVAPLLAEPRISSEQISERPAGHILDVLESREPWLRVRGPDGYEGWTHIGYLADYPDDARPWRTSVGCTVATPADTLLPLPLGALVPPDAQVVDGGALTPAEVADLYPRTRDAVARTARSAFAGTRYAWGGVTPWGADCSGFVQTVFALHGIPLPRDAWQQAQHGTATPAHALADLLFFSDRDDRRPTHVGIVVAVTPTVMAHVALGRGGFSIDRLDAPDPYVTSLMARLTGAVRLIFEGHGTRRDHDPGRAS